MEKWNGYKQLAEVFYFFILFLRCLDSLDDNNSCEDKNVFQ